MLLYCCCNHLDTERVLQETKTTNAYLVFMLGGTVDIILAPSTEGKVGFVKIEVTIRLLARKNGQADAKSSNKNRSTRTIVPARRASLFFSFCEAYKSSGRMLSKLPSA